MLICMWCHEGIEKDTEIDSGHPLLDGMVYCSTDCEAAGIEAAIDWAAQEAVYEIETHLRGGV